MIKKKMNITSGECLNEILTKKYLDEVFVPFNEAMIKGTYSYSLFSHEFLQERANVHQVSIEEYKSKLEGFLNLLHNLKQIEEVVLWFGDEPFCQANIKVVLQTLKCKQFKGKIVLNTVNEESGEIINSQDL